MGRQKTPERVKRLKKSKRVPFHIGTVIDEIEERAHKLEQEKIKEKKNE